MRICNLDTVVDIEMRIPTVEGNIRSAAVINARTEADVIRVESTESGDDALYILRKHQFNFVLLDHRLSDKEGATLISRIRLAQHDISIIAFSISSQARFKAPSAGADDLIDPDIDRDELIARVRAVLRLSRGVSQSLLLVGNLTLDQHNVTVNGMHVLLTAKEFAISRAAGSAPERDDDQKALCGQLYGGTDEPETTIIDTFVCKIGKKLAKAGLLHIISIGSECRYIVKIFVPDTSRSTSTRTQEIMLRSKPTRSDRVERQYSIVNINIV